MLTGNQHAYALLLVVLSDACLRCATSVKQGTNVCSSMLLIGFQSFPWYFQCLTYAHSACVLGSFCPDWIADIIAGRSYIHKIDAVLIPKSTLAYLEKFTADSGKNKTTNATVAEAFGGNATANATAKANATAEALPATAKPAANTTAGTAEAANTTTPAKSGAASLAAVALAGVPALLAVLLL